MQEKRHDKNNKKATSAILTPAKKRILFVDDDPAIRDAISIILERAGFEFETKATATDIIKNNYDIPDLFLINKQLSGHSGLDLCQKLKSKKATWHIPVIILSAAQGLEVLSFEAGADDYIEKPFKVKFVVDMINYYVNRKSSPDKNLKKKFREHISL